MGVDNGLASFFGARDVVVLGASARQGSLGLRLGKNLIDAGFDGRISFVNPSGGELLGRLILPHLSEVDGTPDLAVVLVPARAVPDTLEECARKGIRRVVVASGGFRETGDEGDELETRIASIVKSTGIRVVGPNCVGLVAPSMGLDTSFLGGPPVPGGRIGLATHSGALCAAVVDWGRADGFGFSRLVSLGNCVDLDEADAVDALAADSDTRVIALYLEGTNDGRKLVSAIRAASETKPVIVLKSGRTPEGRHAAASHTGALAGSDRAWDAALKRAGAYRVETTEQLFDLARTLDRCALPRTAGVAVITNAGGPGVAAVDALGSFHMPLATWSASTSNRLAELLPSAGSASNPVDMLASASPDLYGGVLGTVLSDEDVGSALVILPPPPGYSAESVAAAIVDAGRISRKPVVTALMGAQGVEHARELLGKEDYPSFRYPEQAAFALSALWRIKELRGRPQPGEEQENRPATVPSRKLPSGWLRSDKAFGLLESCGLECAPHRLAASPESAIAAARAIGFPVALKVECREAIHKLSADGLVLGVTSEAKVHGTFDRFEASFSEDGFVGILVQKMVPPGEELIIGLSHDPQFGPLALVGAGGSDVERAPDIALVLAPSDRTECSDALHSTRIGRMLTPGQRSQCANVLASVSRLVSAHPQLAEMDVNPIRWVDDRFMALDVRARLR